MEKIEDKAMANYVFVGEAGLGGAKVVLANGATRRDAFHNVADCDGTLLVKGSPTYDGVPADNSPSDIPGASRVAHADMDRMRILNLDAADLPLRVALLTQTGHANRSAVLTPLRDVRGNSGNPSSDLLASSAMFVQEAFAAGDAAGNPDVTAGRFMAIAKGNGDDKGLHGVKLGQVTYLAPETLAAQIVRVPDAPAPPSSAPLQPLPPHMIRELAMISAGYETELSPASVAWGEENAPQPPGDTVTLYGSRTFDLIADPELQASAALRFKRDFGMELAEALEGAGPSDLADASGSARTVVWSADPTVAARRATGKGMSVDQTVGVTFEATFDRSDVMLALGGLESSRGFAVSRTMEGAEHDVVLAEGAVPLSMKVRSVTMSPEAAALAGGKVSPRAMPQSPRANMDLSEFEFSNDRQKIQAVAEAIARPAARNPASASPGASSLQAPVAAPIAANVRQAVNAAGFRTDPTIGDERTRHGQARHHAEVVEAAMDSGNPVERIRALIQAPGLIQDAQLGSEGLDRAEAALFVPLEDVATMSTQAKVFDLQRMGISSIPVRRGQDPVEALNEAALRETPFRNDPRRLPENRRVAALIGTMVERAKATKAGDKAGANVCLQELPHILANVTERSPASLAIRLERERPGLLDQAKKMIENVTPRPLPAPAAVEARAAPFAPQGV